MRTTKLPDPKVNGNAGSSSKILLFLPKLLTRCWHNFQSPTLPPGGWFSKTGCRLADCQCQLKGTQIGGAAVHRQQARFS